MSERFYGLYKLAMHLLSKYYKPKLKLPATPSATIHLSTVNIRPALGSLGKGRNVAIPSLFELHIIVALLYEMALATVLL